jgi:uncharacterized small protein (DUF1192 family)
MELKIEQLSNATAPDLTGIETNGFAVLDLDKNISILEKEIELLKVQLQELKINSSNPLSQ